jgi:hypothetical protein
MCISLLMVDMALAQGAWSGESRVPDTFSKAVIEMLRASFWGKMRLPNDEIVQPISEEERRSIPIPEKLANSLVTAGTLAAAAEQCGLDTSAFERRVERSAYDAHPELKQVVFSATLISLSKKIAKKQLEKDAPCDSNQRVSFAQLLGI